MYAAEFFDAAGGPRERIVLGMLPDAAQADLEAMRLFEVVQLRLPDVVGYRILNGNDEEVASRLTRA